MKSSNLSESLDGPDGWVDTLMQVAVCDKVSSPALQNKSGGTCIWYSYVNSTAKGLCFITICHYL